MPDDALIRAPGPKPVVDQGRQWFSLSTMPRYKCHKEVLAGRIKTMANNFNGIVLQSVTLVFEEAESRPETVDAAWVDKHRPAVGGYFVRYVDGYTSFSPGKAFEDGYTRISV